MPALKFIGLSVLMALAMGAAGVEARDASRAASPSVPGYAIPNPYAPPVPAANSGDRAADAYATGFAIGLGTHLMNHQLNKQREDELKRAREENKSRR